MAKCPHGDHVLRLPERAELNMWHYKGQTLVVTECCGKPVIAYPVTTYRAEAYTGSQDEDDWGTRIPKREKA